MRGARRPANQRGWLWAAIDRLRNVFAGRSPKEASPSGSTRLLKQFSDGSRVEFGFGSFDEWCVFVTRPPAPRQAPRDTDYFAELKILHTRFPRLHCDFVQVFERTGRAVDATALEHITELAAHYPAAERLQIDLLLTTLYAAMIAEESRAHAPLGKRIKRLGVHQVLVENVPVAVAANFSRGKPWRELAAECERRGF